MPPEAPLRALLSIVTLAGFTTIVPPLLVLLLVAYGASRRYRRTRAAVWRATMWGIYGTLFVFVACSLWVLHDVSVSRRSTAIVGVVAIPFVVLPFSFIVFLVVWSAGVLVLRWRAPQTVSVSPDERAAPGVPSSAVATAFVILVGAGGLLAADRYTRHVVSSRARTSSPERLRQVAHSTWAKVDSRVLVAVAGNDDIPEDLVRELSRSSDDVQTALAYNRRTPSDVLAEMSKTNWSAAHVLADASRREVVTPEALRRLAAARLQLDMVAKNPDTPADVLEDLSTVVPELVARNPNTPPDVLRTIFAMTTGSDWPWLKAYTAERALRANPSTPRDILDQLSNPGPRTRAYAPVESSTPAP